MPRAFLSYARSSIAEVQNLAGDIGALNHEVWFDQSIGVGQAWWDEILREIRAADVFVLCISADWRGSQPCQLEWQYARDLGKQHLVVLVEPDFDHRELPPDLALVNYLDYGPADKEAYQELARTLEKLPGAPILPDPLPHPPEAPVSQLSILSDKIRQAALSPEEQDSLVLDLRRRLRLADERDPARKLLKELRRRKDITGDARDDIDKALDAGRKRGPSGQKLSPGGADSAYHKTKSLKDRFGTQALSVVKNELTRLGGLKEELEQCFDSIKLSTDLELAHLAAIEERLDQGSSADWAEVEHWRRLGSALKDARKTVKEMESRLGHDEFIAGRVSGMADDLKALTVRVGKMTRPKPDEDPGELELEIRDWLDEMNAEAAPDLAKECTERTRTRLRAMQDSINSLSKVLVLPEGPAWGQAPQGTGATSASGGSGHTRFVRPPGTPGRRGQATPLRKRQGP